MNKNYYNILNVDKHADQDTIKKAYRKLAMKYHPDRNQDNIKAAEIKFKEINAAYDILKDHVKRQNYDNFSHSGNKIDLFNKAQTLYQQHNFYEAIRYLDRILEIDNNFSFALALKGIILYNIGRFEDSLFYLQKTLTVDPNFNQSQEIKNLINNINRNKNRSMFNRTNARPSLFNPIPTWNSKNIFQSILNIVFWILLSTFRLLFGIIILILLF